MKDIFITKTNAEISSQSKRWFLLICKMHMIEYLKYSVEETRNGFRLKDVKRSIWDVSLGRDKQCPM